MVSKNIHRQIRYTLINTLIERFLPNFSSANHFSSSLNDNNPSVFNYEHVRWSQRLLITFILPTVNNGWRSDSCERTPSIYSCSEFYYLRRSGPRQVCAPACLRVSPDEIVCVRKSVQTARATGFKWETTRRYDRTVRRLDADWRRRVAAARRRPNGVCSSECTLTMPLYNGRNHGQERTNSGHRGKRRISEGTGKIDFLEQSCWV